MDVSAQPGNRGVESKKAKKRRANKKNPAPQQVAQSAPEPEENKENAVGDGTISDPQLRANLVKKIAELEERQSEINREQQLLVEKTRNANAILAASTPAETRLPQLHTLLLDEYTSCAKARTEVCALKRQLATITRDRDAFQIRYDAETQAHGRTTALKNRIEALCHELQKQNKSIREEAHRIELTENEKRDEMAKRVEQTLSNVTKRLDEQADEAESVRKENELLKFKLEKMTEFVTKSTECHKRELEVYAAELEKFRLLQVEDHLEKDKLREGLKISMENEIALREQLKEWPAKFDEAIQTTKALVKTSDQRVKELRTRVALLEKENSSLKQAAALSGVMLSDERTKATKLQRQKDTLESVCRALKESNTLLVQRLADAPQASSGSPLASGPCENASLVEDPSCPEGTGGDTASPLEESQPVE